MKNEQGMLHSEVRNNINNDNLWADVNELIKSKSNIAIYE